MFAGAAADRFQHAEVLQGICRAADRRPVVENAVAEVLDHRAIANVMPDATLDEIQEGDKVLY